MPLLEGEKTEPFAASLNCCVCAPGEPGWAAAAAAISHAPSSSQQRKVRPACLHAREHTQWQGSQVCSCSGGVKELAEVKPMHAAASVTASSNSIVAATSSQHESTRSRAGVCVVASTRVVAIVNFSLDHASRSRCNSLRVSIDRHIYIYTENRRLHPRDRPRRCHGDGQRGKASCMRPCP